MLRSAGEDNYWRLTLQYGIDGNLQAVLDEYVNVLRESLGLQEHSPEEQVAGNTECIQSVLSLRTARIRIDEKKPREMNILLMISILTAGLRFVSEIFAMTITSRLFTPITFGTPLVRRLVNLVYPRFDLTRPGIVGFPHMAPRGSALEFAI